MYATYDDLYNNCDECGDFVLKWSICTKCASYHCGYHPCNYDLDSWDGDDSCVIIKASKDITISGNVTDNVRCQFCDMYLPCDCQIQW